jgi:maltokinase
VTHPLGHLDELVLPGGALLEMLADGDELRVELRPPSGEGSATAGDGAFEGLLALLRAGGSIDRFSFTRLMDAPEATGERELEVDQSNRSVIVGERVVVKVFPRTSEGPQPAMDLPAHLAEVGFGAMPAPFGAVTWTTRDGAPVLVATAASYLPGARDGWSWYLDLLLGWLVGTVDDSAAFEPAVPTGRLAGSMHTALATRSSVFANPVGYVDADAIGTWKVRAHVALDEALALTDGAPGEHLKAREGRIRSAFDVFDETDSGFAIRIHGDLHVGQILRWDGGDAVTDFDGNPLSPPEVRVARDSPMRDLASLLRSIDHLGRIAQRRGVGTQDRIGSWVERTRASILEGYLEGLSEGGQGSLFQPSLLYPLEIAQVCHEFAYAARFQPSWVEIPDLAIQAMFP